MSDLQTFAANKSTRASFWAISCFVVQCVSSHWRSLEQQTNHLISLYNKKILWYIYMYIYIFTYLYKRHVDEHSHVICISHIYIYTHIYTHTYTCNIGIRLNLSNINQCPVWGMLRCPGTLWQRWFKQRWPLADEILEGPGGANAPAGQWRMWEKRVNNFLTSTYLTSTHNISYIYI